MIHESSPYLRQHANNPVDWYPWGSEALERAVREDKPILLSVGYSACHWCHVMERESFEDDGIAALMNEHFVSIKVDREERADIDSIYMAAVQAMTGQGGWPMTVFLTPDGKPFYGGTYFPPEDRGGLPSFPRLLNAMADVYRNRRGDVANTTAQVVAHMQQMTRSAPGIEPLTDDIMAQAVRELRKQFDDKYGGFGLQPKFPQPMTLEFLLRQYLRTEDPAVLEMVELTLDGMARGGIYDQLGGGFHRYSTDTYWLVPHFEKMLYDNALLARLYLHAYQVTGNSMYRKNVEETLDYVVREMTSPEGGFYSAQDADSEGEEGKFFVWRPEEIVEVLGAEDGKLVNDYYGVTIHGNFEGRSILHVPTPLPDFARSTGMDVDSLERRLQDARAKLLERRASRIAPERDDKILTSWNGLMLAAFAEASVVLDRDDYRAVAVDNGAFLLDQLVDESGRLLRTYKDGQAKLYAYLEDYAFLIDGLLLVHEATSGERWLTRPSSLAGRWSTCFGTRRPSSSTTPARTTRRLSSDPATLPTTPPLQEAPWRPACCSDSPSSRVIPSATRGPPPRYVRPKLSCRGSRLRRATGWGPWASTCPGPRKSSSSATEKTMRPPNSSMRFFAITCPTGSLLEPRVRAQATARIFPCCKTGI